MPSTPHIARGTGRDDENPAPANKSRPQDEPAQYASILRLLENGRGIAWCRPTMESPSVYWSRISDDFLGFTPQTRPPGVALFRELYHPGDHASLRTSLASMIRDGLADFICDLRIRAMDGHYEWCRMLNMSTLDPDGLPGSLGITRLLGRSDGPEVPPPEDMGKPSARVKAFVLGDHTTAVVVTTPDGRMVQANRHALHLTHLQGSPQPHRVEEFVGSWSALDEDVPRVLDLVVRDQTSERIIGSTGRWVRVTALPLRAPDSATGVVMLMAKDVTPLLESLEESANREKQLMDALVREVHHRVKNHLQGLMGVLRFLGSTTKSPDQIIDSAVAHLQSIATVHGVLGGDSGREPALAMVLEELAHQARRSSAIPLTVECAPDARTLALAAEPMVQVSLILNEMLTNALKHTPLHAEASIMVKLSIHGDFAQVEVRNSPAQLEYSGDSAHAGTTHSGLQLIHALMPRNQGSFRVAQESPEAVVARLTLSASLLYRDGK